MLFHMTGKDQVYQLMDSITIHFDRIRSMSLEAVKELKLVSDHQAIVEAIVAQDSDKAKTLMEKYSGRILRMLDAGKKAGLIDKKVESRVAAGLFIGIIQGLVLQSRLSGAAVSVSRNAAGVFALFRRGIEEGDQS